MITNSRSKRKAPGGTGRDLDVFDQVQAFGFQPANKKEEYMKQTAKEADSKLSVPKGGRVRFHTQILQAGKTATGIQIPNEVVESLGSGKRPPVRVTINAQTYRSTVAVTGGKFTVGVSAENREKTGVAGGDEVDVEIELDAEPREVSVPADFAKALKGNAVAKKRFNGLSYSRKQGFVSGVEEPKRRKPGNGALRKLLTN
jgi:hypothetical protein